MARAQAWQPTPATGWAFCTTQPVALTAQLVAVFQEGEVDPEGCLPIPWAKVRHSAVQEREGPWETGDGIDRADESAKGKAGSASRACCTSPGCNVDFTPKL